MTTVATTASDFRENFKKFSDNVTDYNEELIITRPKQKNVVLISEKEYNSIKETNYLLSSEANRKALDESIEQLGQRKSKILTPEDWEKIQDEI